VKRGTTAPRNSSVSRCEDWSMKDTCFHLSGIFVSLPASEGLLKTRTGSVLFVHRLMAGTQKRAALVVGCEPRRRLG
jgi:hypothetical protein